MRRKTDDSALSDDEIAALRSDRTPDAIKQFVSRSHREVGVRASAYRKVAAAARAEREALYEIRLLQIARLKAGEPIDVVEAVDNAVPPVGFQTAGELAQENARLRQAVEALTAGDAMAVHSGRD